MANAKDDPILDALSFYIHVAQDQPQNRIHYLDSLVRDAAELKAKLLEASQTTKLDAGRMPAIGDRLSEDINHMRLLAICARDAATPAAAHDFLDALIVFSENLESKLEAEGK